MSWLSFNDGLNNLKGQISNFAQSVLTEDGEESVPSSSEIEELKKICYEHKQEIARLQKENEDLKNQEATEHETWNWVNTDDGKSEEEIKKLKKEITNLQNENKDLVSQLEQLDADNQENVSKLVEVKTKLQNELQQTKEKIHDLELLHGECLDREKSLQKELRLSKEELEKKQVLESELNNKYQRLLEEQLLATDVKKDAENELTTQLQKELQGLRKSYSELEQLYNNSLAKEKVQEEELIKINKRYEEELEKCKSELETKYQRLLEEQCHTTKQLQEFRTSYSELEQLHNNSLDKEKFQEEQLAKINKQHEEELEKLKHELENKYQSLLEEQRQATNVKNEENEVTSQLQKQLQDQRKSYSELEQLYNNNSAKVKLQEEELGKINKLHEEELEKLKNELENKYQSLLEEQRQATVVQKNEENKGTGQLQKEHQEHGKSFLELEEFYKNSLAKEKFQEEELDKINKRHEEEIEKLKKAEKEMRKKYENLRDFEKRVQVNKTDFSANETNTCEELVDCDLQGCSFEKNEELTDGYGILKQLFNTYKLTLAILIETVISLGRQYDTTDLRSIKNQLNVLQDETQAMAEQNELIHSKYLCSDDFKDQTDSVVLESLKQQNDVLKENINILYEDVFSEIEDVEAKYVAIFKSTFFRYSKRLHEICKGFKPSENVSKSGKTSRHSELTELHSLLREIYLFMNDLKSNAVVLTDIVNIINAHSLDNVEELMPEEKKKNEIIQVYEIEIAELTKNNDLLIAELQAYKNPHLETISEFNEDNTILLEEQLETANAQIMELNNRLRILESDDINQADSEDSKADEDNTYLELLNKYDGLQTDYQMLKKDLMKRENELQMLQTENVSLKSSVDSLKGNSENLMYLQDELKTLNDSLQSDIEAYKQKLDELVQANAKLKTTSEDYETLKAEVNDVREKFEAEQKTNIVMKDELLELTEMLKSTKTAQNLLQLKCDSMNKEYANVVEISQSLREKLKAIESTKSSSDEIIQDLKIQNEELGMEIRNLKKQLHIQEDLFKKSQDLIAIEKNSQEGDKNQAELEREIQELRAQNEKLRMEIQNLKENLSTQKDLPQKSEDNIGEIKAEHAKEIQQLQEENLTLKSKLEGYERAHTGMIEIINNKHQESVGYHNELQRARQLLQEETSKFWKLESDLDRVRKERTAENEEKRAKLEKMEEENMNLKEQCKLLSQSLLDEQDKVTKLLDEKSNPSEAEITLKRKLERLQTHLIELEEHYTKELYEAEQKNLVLQASVNEIEEREKSSSTMYTSVSIRANQQVEALQNQLQVMTSERDSLRRQISDLEDTINKQTAALTNLQLVLEQFRKDKEKEIHKETERLRRQINAEKKTQDDLKNEISSLRSQLQESKQGLLAATRLSDQLESSKNAIGALKEEVTQLQSSLASKQEELKAALSQTDGKVDKSLIKNLIIGFVTTNNNLNKDQTQILKIIGTVLDFNQQDHDKLNLNKGLQGSWLSSLLSPQGNLQNASQESLSRAFIEFLEKESKPIVVPSLLNANTEASTSPSRKLSVPRQSPANLSEIVLPTFADFAQTRNSSSILKDVLKDHS